MRRSEAIIEMQNGALCLAALCDHWAADFSVEKNGAWARIVLPQTICKVVATPSTLLVQLEVMSDANQRQIEETVEHHIRRFGELAHLKLLWRHP